MQYVDAQSLTCGVPKSIPFYAIPYRQNANISLAITVEGENAPTARAFSLLGGLVELRGSVRLISDSPEAGYTIKSDIRTNHWFLVKAAEAGNPIVIFAEALSDQGQLTVHIRRGLCDSPVQRVDFPPLEIIPSSRRILETGSDLRQADDRSSDICPALLRQERPRRSPSALLSLLGKVDQECRVGYHLRPPDRRPLCFSKRLSAKACTLGGGSCSYASSNSPAVSAGLWTYRRSTLVKESPWSRLREDNNL
jgi:hypothetical protein